MRTPAKRERIFGGLSILSEKFRSTVHEENRNDTAQVIAHKHALDTCQKKLARHQLHSGGFLPLPCLRESRRFGQPGPLIRLPFKRCGQRILDSMRFLIGPGFHEMLYILNTTVDSYHSGGVAVENDDKIVAVTAEVVFRVRQ